MNIERDGNGDQEQDGSLGLECPDELVGTGGVDSSKSNISHAQAIQKLKAAELDVFHSVDTVSLRFVLNELKELAQTGYDITKIPNKIIKEWIEVVYNEQQNEPIGLKAFLDPQK